MQCKTPAGQQHTAAINVGDALTGSHRPIRLPVSPAKRPNLELLLARTECPSSNQPRDALEDHQKSPLLIIVVETAIVAFAALSGNTQAELLGAGAGTLSETVKRVG